MSPGPFVFGGSMFRGFMQVVLQRVTGGDDELLVRPQDVKAVSLFGAPNTTVRIFVGDRWFVTDETVESLDSKMAAVDGGSPAPLVGDPNDK